MADHSDAVCVNFVAHGPVISGGFLNAGFDEVVLLEALFIFQVPEGDRIEAYPLLVICRNASDADGFYVFLAWRRIGFHRHKNPPGLRRHEEVTIRCD